MSFGPRFHPTALASIRGLHTLSPVFWILLSAAAFIAGAANALAGGGTFLTFPTLLLAGFDPISANATSAVMLLPGGVASAWVYRRQTPIRGKPLAWILTGCVLGGILGSQLLLMTPSQRFARIAPYLMLVAAVIYTFSKQLAAFSARHSDGRTYMKTVIAFQFLISIYGGYFGAGMGVLTIVLFRLAAQLDVQESAGLRMICAFAINSLATANFILRGVVDWHVALPMLVFAIVGGIVGARVFQKLSPEIARRIVLTYAWATGIWLLAR